MSQYWLFKSEPSSFSIEDLRKAPQKRTCWEGVRNYQARNSMQTMKRGDLAFFYHSNADPPAIMGMVKVVKEAYPDHYALDPTNRYYDEKSTTANPRWVMVDVQLVQIFSHPLSLDMLRGIKGIEKMELLRKGSRLSVQAVRESEWEKILSCIQQ
jgi:predicted RNA-binding protein with PUA-like domain